MIDEEMCINCGKCYMTCNDSGYQVRTLRRSGCQEARFLQLLSQKTVLCGQVYDSDQACHRGPPAVAPHPRSVSLGRGKPRLTVTVPPFLTWYCFNTRSSPTDDTREGRFQPKRESHPIMDSRKHCDSIPGAGPSPPHVAVSLKGHDPFCQEKSPPPTVDWASATLRTERHLPSWLGGWGARAPLFWKSPQVRFFPGLPLSWTCRGASVRKRASTVRRLHMRSKIIYTQLVNL